MDQQEFLRHNLNINKFWGNYSQQQLQLLNNKTQTKAIELSLMMVSTQAKQLTIYIFIFLEENSLHGLLVHLYDSIHIKCQKYKFILFAKQQTINGINGVSLYYYQFVQQKTKMYFSDQDMLEKHLHNDLNILIKNIKSRQQQYLRLVQSNWSLSNTLKAINTDVTILISDETVKYSAIQKILKKQHQELLAEQEEMTSKYRGIMIKEQAIARLLSRVGARILEMFQNYFQKSNQSKINIEDRYKKMRNAVMKSLNQKDKIDLTELIASVMNYSREKIADEMQTLTNLIQILQEGEVEKIIDKYQKTFLKPPPENKKHSLSKDPKQTDKIKQKIADLKDHEKKIQKIRKQKTKLANYMFNGLYSTMDLAKNHFMEDIICFNPQEKYKKLYDEILSRNKYNQQQIIAFQSQKEDFYQKVRKFKEKMEAESNKIQQALIFKIHRKQPTFPILENNFHTQQQSPKKNIQVRNFVQETQSDGQKYEEQAEILTLKMENQKSQNQIRIRQNKGLSPRQKFQYIPLQSMQGTQQGFRHIKFDTSKQQVYLRSNRARLPQISNRMVGQALEGRKKSTKNQQRVNIVKNIDINIQSQKNRFSSKMEKFVEKNKNRDSQQKRKDSLPKSLEYTFYIKKKTNKFYETKNQFIV